MECAISRVGIKHALHALTGGYHAETARYGVDSERETECTGNTDVQKSDTTRTGRCAAEDPGKTTPANTQPSAPPTLLPLLPKRELHPPPQWLGMARSALPASLKDGR